MWSAARLRSKSLSHRRFRVLTWFSLLTICLSSLPAQTLDDGIMVPRNDLFAGLLSSHDSWDHYWEGSLYRVNGNIGTIPTQTTAWTGTFGILDRLNLIATVPYVWTDASQGVLSGMKGWQDVTLGAKYRIIRKSFGDSALSVFGVAYGEIGQPKTRRTEVRPISSLRAISDLLTPVRCSFRISAACMAPVAGRPSRFPFSRA